MAPVFLVVTVCALLHQGELTHEKAESAGSHCCIIIPSGLDLVQSYVAPFFPAPLFFLLMVVFFIPSKIPLNLYHPPRY